MEALTHQQSNQIVIYSRTQAGFGDIRTASPLQPLAENGGLPDINKPARPSWPGTNANIRVATALPDQIRICSCEYTNMLPVVVKQKACIAPSYLLRCELHVPSTHQHYCHARSQWHQIRADLTCVCHYHRFTYIRVRQGSG